MEYIPSKDSEAKDYFLTYAGKLVLEPARWNVSPADAAHFLELAEVFAERYNVLVDEEKRTAPRILAKDQSRNSVEQLCRVISMQIKLNPGISDQDKLAIGVRPVNPSREPIFPPGTKPELGIAGALKGSHTVTYSDPVSGRRRKPAGAANVQLFVAVGDEPTTNPDEGRYYATFGRNPMAVGFDNSQDGKVATYFGRWVSPRGETGPWSDPMSMRIAA